MKLVVMGRHLEYVFLRLFLEHINEKYNRTNDLINNILTHLIYITMICLTKNRSQRDESTIYRMMKNQAVASLAFSEASTNLSATLWAVLLAPCLMLLPTSTALSLAFEAA
jgi:uncharacterized membrane protein